MSPEQLANKLREGHSADDEFSVALQAAEMLESLSSKLDAMTIRAEAAEADWQESERRLGPALQRVEWYETNLTNKSNPHYDPDTVEAARMTWPFPVERQKPGCDGKHGPPECSSPYCWRGPIMNA